MFFVSVQKMVGPNRYTILIFYEFGLKMPIYALFVKFLGDKLAIGLSSKFFDHVCFKPKYVNCKRIQ